MQFTFTIQTFSKYLRYFTVKIVHPQAPDLQALKHCPEKLHATVNPIVLLRSRNF